MRPGELVRQIRSDAQLSLRALAEAAGVATSTVHRIERGELHPTVETLERITGAAGTRLRVDAELDYAASIVGLARSIEEALSDGDGASPVRMAAELVHRFDAADPDMRSRMIAARPPWTGDERWDAFLGGLAEWLAVRSGQPAPAWSHHSRRYLRRAWWPTPMKSMRAWEYAGSAASFQTRGVYLHRESLQRLGGVVLTRQGILELFGELNDELCRSKLRGDVFSVGGAAMTVAYDARPATRDVDAIWHPSVEVRAAAARVAARHDDLEPDWLNDGVKGFLPGDDQVEKRVVYDNECLTVSAASPEYLLATKLMASRVSRDEDDILLLYGVCGFTTVDEGLEVMERYYPGRPVEATMRFFLEELLEGGP